MIYIIYLLILCACNIIIPIFTIETLVKEKVSFNKWLLLCLLISMCFIEYFYSPHYFQSTLCIFIVLLLSIKSKYEFSIPYLLGFFIVANLIIMPIVNIVSFFLFNGFIDVEVYAAFSGPFSQSNSEFIYKLVYILNLLFFQNQKIEKIELIEKKYWYYLYMFIITCSLLLIIFMTFTAHINDEKYVILLSFLATTITVLFYLFNSFFLSFYNNTLEKHQLFVEKEKTKLEFNALLLNQKNIEEIKKFRHDIQNNFIIIKHLIQDEQYQVAMNYLNEYTKSFSEVNKYIQTDNLIVSAIINEKISKYPTITFNVKCMLSANISIKDLDFGTILGNLVDNACEYMDRMCISETLSIRILSHNNCDLFIEIKNPCFENDFTSETLVTKKENKEFHGYGIINVQKTIDEYDGTFTKRIEAGLFIVQVLIPGGGESK